MLAEWLIKEVEKIGFSPKRVIDPAAGDGALLIAAGKQFPRAKLIGFEINGKEFRKLLEQGLAEGQHGDALLKEDWHNQRVPTLYFSNPPWGATIANNCVRY